MPEFFCRASAEIDATTLYRLLALRCEVFVVEQRCAYLDLDGRDLEPTTLQLWAADHWVDEHQADEHEVAEETGYPSNPHSGGPHPNDVLATLRLLRDPDSWRIGRVATARHARSAGLASRLITLALEQAQLREPELAVVLDAQSSLQGWYERFGFSVYGKEFTEDGIAHTPMRRPAPKPDQRNGTDGLE